MEETLLECNARMLKRTLNPPPLKQNYMASQIKEEESNLMIDFCKASTCGDLDEFNRFFKEEGCSFSHLNASGYYTL